MQHTQQTCSVKLVFLLVTGQNIVPNISCIMSQINTVGFNRVCKLELHKQLNYCNCGSLRTHNLWNSSIKGCTRSLSSVMTMFSMLFCTAVSVQLREPLISRRLSTTANLWCMYTEPTLQRTQMPGGGMSYLNLNFLSISPPRTLSQWWFQSLHVWKMAFKIYIQLNFKQAKNK